MWSWLSELRAIRRPLMTLAILFFTVMLLEVDLGHAPALARRSFLALVPVFWLPITLFALIAVQIKPNLVSVSAAMFATAVAFAVGMIGSGLHMQAAGVDLEHLGRVFSSTVWGGHESPNWPVAITIAAVLGFAASVNAHHDQQSLPHDFTGAVTAFADLLIVAGIASATVSGLAVAGSACLVIAALLLLAVLVAQVAGATMERSMS
jgi:hypothetical protein